MSPNFRPILQMERSLHGITWKDDLYWMESMKTARWNGFLKEEQGLWKKVVSDKKSMIREIGKTILAASHVSEEMRFEVGDAVVAHLGRTAYLWKWIDSKQDPSLVANIWASSSTAWVIEEWGEGKEEYVLCCYKRGIKKPVWTAHGVGPYVAVVGGRCYTVQVKNRLIYYRCLSFDAETGAGRKIEYEEKDSSYNLEIIRGDDCAFLSRQSGGKQDILEISGDSKTQLEGISAASRRFVLGDKAGEYFVWMAGKGWETSQGLRRLGLWFPSFVRAVPEELHTARALLITRWYGMRTLWRLRKGATPISVWQGVGNITLDPFGGPWIRFITPAAQPLWWKHTNGPHPSVNSPTHNVVWRSTRSRDGTMIPFVMVLPKRARAQGLFIPAYSAYGLSSSFSTIRWTPLLKRGWAICFAMYRGGGDHTPDWEDAGRRAGRLSVLEDAEAVVLAARKVVQMPAARTVIYGRSAGGLWVGGLCARFPNGDLFGGAYMEVPYVDVLRTVTNRSLPLTDLEMDEFGLPEERLSDFASVLRWSPMETLGVEGTPGIWQIVRTGLNDSQVFAYESAKWVVRCRAGDSGRPIYLAINGDQGHFVYGNTGLEQQAEDLAVLLERAL